MHYLPFGLLQIISDLANCKITWLRLKPALRLQIAALITNKNRNFHSGLLLACSQLMLWRAHLLYPGMISDELHDGEVRLSLGVLEVLQKYIPQNRPIYTFFKLLQKGSITRLKVTWNCPKCTDLSFPRMPCLQPQPTDPTPSNSLTVLNRRSWQSTVQPHTRGK